MATIGTKGLLLLAVASATSVSQAVAPSLPDCVILLHGLARTSRSMQPVEAVLSEHGYEVVNVDYPSRKFRIADLAEMAVDRGLTLCGERGTRDIHFVTHSLGGILVRYYLDHHSLKNLGRVVMLAPPNQGSEVVDVFANVPGYSFLNGPAGAELGTREQSVPLSLGPVNYPVGIIAGTRSINPLLSAVLPNPDDGKVSLERTKVQGMTDFIAYPVSHPLIMDSDLVLRQVVNFIDTGAFVHNEP